MAYFAFSYQILPSGSATLFGVAQSCRNSIALVLIVPPVPVGLLVGIVTFFEIHVVAVRAMFPLVVVNDFVTVPSVVVAVAPIVDASVNSATGRK
jgi:hypothetical protein